MNIKSNHHPRPLMALGDIPVKAREDFDYIQGEDIYSLRLFEYRGGWYDVNEFTVTGPEFAALGWDGFQGESYFSAVIVKYFDEYGWYNDESIIVGYAHW